MKASSFFDLPNTPLERGVTLVEASAGTGKTYSLAGLILRLILEEHIPIQQILAVTYTIAATGELKDRVRARLQSALRDLRRGATEDEILKRIITKRNIRQGIRDLDLALQSFDEAQVFTIHGFCKRVLRDHAFESGMVFDTELVADATPLFEQVAKDFWRLKFFPSSTLVSALAIAWEKSPADWANLLEKVQRHPDLALIPSVTRKPLTQRVSELEASLNEIRREWKSQQRTIEQILHKDGSLSRGQNAFNLVRVAEILESLNEISDDLDQLNPRSIGALRETTADVIAKRTKQRSISPAHKFFDLCGTFVQLATELFDSLTYDFLHYAKEELRKRKAKTRTVSFDDLVLWLHDALDSQKRNNLSAAIGRDYQAALIDEFQDTDPAQYQIFQRIFGNGNHRLFYVGDPKQAIFGFRGADVFTYLAAAKSADRTYSLATNWRTEKKLVKAINKLFLQAQNPFVLPKISYQAVRPSPGGQVPTLSRLPDDISAPLQFRIVPSNRSDDKPMNQADANAAICAALREDIVRLKTSGVQLGSRPLGLGDMVVLVRRHSHASEMQEALLKRGVRSIVQSDRSVFATTEASDLERLLLGIIEPKRPRLFTAALATSLIGFNSTNLQLLDQNETARQEWLDRFSAWQTRWNDDGFIGAFRQILVEQDVRARVLALPNGERRLTNFLHLAELLHAVETDQRLRPESLCSWFQRQRKKKKIERDEFQLRLESDADAVQIVTIHRCKGLEYPVVFCPFLWLPAESDFNKELQFHDRQNNDRLTYDLAGKEGGTDEQKKWQTEELTSEEVRMAYVAITRAKNRCTIYLGNIRNIEKSPLARLFNCSEKTDDLLNSVTEFAERSDGLATTSVVAGETEEIPAAQPKKQLRLMARSFKGTIDRTAMIASFSSLNSGRIDLIGSEPEVLDQPEIISDPQPGDSIFDFARGARAGDFFHAVLQRLDFANPELLESLVDTQLTWHGFTQTPCREAVLERVLELCQVELDPGISLNKVNQTDRLPEVEFTYRLGRLDPKQLRDLFSRCPGLPSDYSKKLGRLRFDPVEGYMHGFIDLLFRSGGRYHVLDWKSNWLGNTPSHYDQQRMRDSMTEHNYFLQSHLYTLAADLFLKARLKDYQFSRDFGGVYYVFLRGVDLQDSNRGIYRQQPSEETIRVLRELIRQNGRSD